MAASAAAQLDGLEDTVRTITALVLCSLLCAAPVVAQTQITTGVIQGTVLDPTG